MIKKTERIISVGIIIIIIKKKKKKKKKKEKRKKVEIKRLG